MAKLKIKLTILNLFFVRRYFTDILLFKICLKKLFLFTSVVFFSCASSDLIIGEKKHKRLLNPILREGVVVIPYKVKLRAFTDVPMQISEMKYRDFQNNYRNVSLENSNNFYKLVVGEKYIIIIDSFGPVSNRFCTEEQGGPFFYKDEKVDTTTGKILTIKHFKSQGRYDISYTFEVNDKKYTKGFACLDTFFFSNGAYVGSEYKVIYDPGNIGRAKLLYEPEGFIFKHPKNKF